MYDSKSICTQACDTLCTDSPLTWAHAENANILFIISLCKTHAIITNLSLDLTIFRWDMWWNTWRSHTLQRKKETRRTKKSYCCSRTSSAVRYIYSWFSSHTWMHTVTPKNPYNYWNLTFRFKLCFRWDSWWKATRSLSLSLKWKRQTWQTSKVQQFSPQPPSARVQQRWSRYIYVCISQRDSEVTWTWGHKENISIKKKEPYRENTERHVFLCISKHVFPSTCVTVCLQKIHHQWVLDFWFEVCF